MFLVHILNDMKDPRSLNNNNDPPLRRGSPAGFFIVFVLIIITLIAVIKFRITKLDGNQMIQDDQLDNNTQKRSLFEVLMPNKNKGPGNNKFLYPQLVNNEENIQRDKFSIERARFIGMDPYSSTFGLPHILVYGSGTAVGAAVVRNLSESGILNIPIKGFLDFDFSAKDVDTVFANVTLSAIIVVYRPPMFRYSQTNGGSYIEEYAQNFTNGIGMFANRRNIPLIFGVCPPYLQVESVADYCYGAKIVYLPEVVDAKEIYDLDNVLLKTVRECQRNNASRVEYIDNSTIDSVTADEAASFLVEQLKNPTPGKVMISGSTKIKIENAIKLIVPQCQLELVKSPHTFKYYNKGCEKIMIKNEIRDLITNSFFTFVERKNIKPYVSIVYAGRHDENFEGFKDRLNKTFYQLNKSLSMNRLLDIEIIFVDYATNTTKFELLSRSISIPDRLKGIFKFINVLQDYHEKYLKKHKFSNTFLEYAAKNIGILRAKGDFIIASNPDSILTNQLLDYVAGRKFNPNAIYCSLIFRLEKKRLVSNTFENLVQVVEEPWKSKRYCYNDIIDAGQNKMAPLFTVNDMKEKMFVSGIGDFIMLSAEMWDGMNGFLESGSNDNIINIQVSKMMRILPGFIRFILPVPIIQQEHSNADVSNNNVQHKVDDWSFSLGYQCILPESIDRYDNFDWGAPDQVFEEILI